MLEMGDPPLKAVGSLQIQPERALGWITLGSSLYHVITRLKASPEQFPTLEISYTPSTPLSNPVILSLASNGLRLRFDGPDQRLRLIEILDFSLVAVTYKNIDLVRRTKSSEEANIEDPTQLGPSFKHVYNRLFGPTYAGEYIQPLSGKTTGTYVLSYPGLAFTFPVKHKSWSDKVDFVSLLSSNATGPALSMAIFSGNSWTEARTTLYNKTPTLPRMPTIGGKLGEVTPDEVEEVRVLGGGKLELVRRSLAPFAMTLNETTPQDIVAELGPPDAIYRKHDRRISIHATGHPVRRRVSMSPGLDPQAIDTDQSSIQSYTEDSDIEAESREDKTGDSTDECFYNYLNHGFDILIARPNNKSAPFPGGAAADSVSWNSSALLVATKIFLHGNVPGSFSFNRHRRSRWVIRTSNESQGSVLTSEMKFQEISSALKDLWRDSYKDEHEEKQMQRGMVLNRGWEESPESSIELLGDMEESPTRETAIDSFSADGNGGLSNTELFGFPGLLFEVLKNDTISCLTVF
ncbi:hypothetical protein PV10_02441 [Exophiala mesophila]|uniref:Isoleucyl-tRNA synthetase n=1 Tax=Exophiala mesophila TaxID=212818 RepID=A0A0D1ZJA0_EXOME|nr:uncharacterized protein PV10_02441 [Exophiala mesophila]KIV94702.1 hypothetical protein PV10_02441 [Exophiala mesophila]